MTVKSTLARLLANENIEVREGNYQTASFDVVNRILNLPLWKDKGADVQDLLVGHEVGHALFTPNDDTLDNPPCPKAYINVTEDARIEKLMKRKYPGLTKDFYGGYQQLNDQDFFCIQDEDLSKMTLIDRVNLHYKIGAYAMLPFDASETPLRDAVGAAETFEEAIAAAVAIYEYAKEQREKQKSVTPSPQGNKQSSGMTHEEMLDKSQEREQQNEASGEGEEPRPWFTDSDPE